MGICIFNIIIGIIGFFLYSAVKSEYKTEKSMMMYAVFIHNIIFLLFNNMFLYLPIIVQFLYIMLIFGKPKEEQKNLNGKEI